MINPNNVLKVLSELTSDKSFVRSPSVITSDEKYIALNFYKCLNSILESKSHSFEAKTTLDHDNELDAQDLEDVESTTSIYEDVSTNNDDDYEPVDEHNLQIISH
jgi:hypothetical protein